ncbi:unnamed protein product, partial [Mesorhabditis belari]|uniref:Structure-specific endonuclease subunit SLX1 homolog n=1 Tax=Mesorhabditis belari TaxID=2138241 RepID=A0AAF3EVD8_9BILA
MEDLDWQFDPIPDYDNHWNAWDGGEQNTPIKESNQTICLDSDEEAGPSKVDESEERSLFLDEYSTPITSTKRRFQSTTRSVSKNAKCSTQVPGNSLSLRRRSYSHCELTPIVKPENRKRKSTEGCLTPAKPVKERVLPKPTRPPKRTFVVNEFFGVYCLINRSNKPRWKNRCYIGKTTDPNRRIEQHNGGMDKGGAKKTHDRGPWDMACIIHGFPNAISTLQFEWAWQNPGKSVTIKGKCLDKKEAKETTFAHNIRIACYLMNCDRWKDLALTFQWLIPKEEIPFPPQVPFPPQMRVAYGLIECGKTAVPIGFDELESLQKCLICGKTIVELRQLGRCLSCRAQHHLICWANGALSTKKQRYLWPVEAKCQKCENVNLWGDIIRDQRMFLKTDEAQKVPELQNLLLKKVLNVM